MKKNDRFGKEWSSDSRDQQYPSDNQATQGLGFLGADAPTTGLHDALWQANDWKDNWLYDQIKTACERYGQSLDLSVGGSRNALADAIRQALLSQNQASESRVGILEIASRDETVKGEDGLRAVVPVHLKAVLDDRFSQLGSASKHNENDFERTGVAADLDGKLWKAVIENFDSKGSADTVQHNLDIANKAAWDGINGAWEKANDAQGRCGHLEYFLHGSDDRAFVYVGDPTGDGILFKQEVGWWSWIYQHQTKMELTPEGKINYATISWGQVTDKCVVGEGDETGLVRMNGGQNIWDVNAKNYAASQYQARQAQETGAAAQKAADAVATRVTTLEPSVAENKSLVRANWNREMLYVGSSDKQNGWFLAFEAGYVNIYWKGVRFFQIDPDKRIKDATISVGQVEGRAEWGDNWFLDKQSGKLWQWGKVYNGGEREAVVRFPRAFRDSNYAIMSMDIGNGGGWHNSRDPQSWGVTLRKNGANNDIAGQWIAFGNA